MNQETEELLQKWLKLEIAKFKWSVITKIVTISLLAIGLIMGAKIIEPIVAQQLQILNTIQGVFLRNNDINHQDDAKSFFDDLDKTLTEEQKQELQIMLRESLTPQK